jgi:3',5'-cyclic AMP phosphodiesterase CpdA
VKLKALKKCVLQINKLDPLPDVVIHTGDLSDNGRTDEYKLIKSLMDELKAPYLITAGNRDSTKNLVNAFDLSSVDYQDQQLLQYGSDIAGYRLVSVDTSSQNSNLGLLNFSKLAHLDGLLRQKQSCPTIIFMHHPPINLSSSETPDHEYENLKMIENFAEIVDRHPQIVACLCGHIHREFSSYINASSIVVIPPLTKKLYRGEFDHSQVPEIAFRLHSFKENAFKDTTVVTVN